MPDEASKARFAVDQYAKLLDRLADLATNSPDVADRHWERAQRSNESRDEKEHEQGRDRYALGIGGTVLDDSDLGSTEQAPKHSDR
jgi:hypothetical protein